MDGLIDTLSANIQSRPDTLQFAKDRKFEEAWIIPVDKPLPDERQLKDYLTRDRFKVLIVEYCWNSNDDDNRFVLTIFQDEKCQLKDPETFLRMNLDLYKNHSDFSNLCKTLDGQVVGGDYFFKTPVEAVTIGIFNHWVSAGPLDLWKSGEIYRQDIVESKLATRPDIMSTSLNYQGLMFRFNFSGQYRGPYYGIKAPCCIKSGDFWKVDIDKIDYWMSKFLL